MKSAGPGFRLTPPPHAARPASRHPDHRLRPAGHRFVGCTARLDPFASRALRLRARKGHPRRSRYAHGWILQQNALPVQRRMIDEASRISGVTAAGTVDNSPLSGDGSSTSVYSEDATDLRPSKAAMEPKYFAISPGYLQAAGTHLLAGRDFTWNDGPSSPKIAIVNETFARKLFSNAPAVGRRFLGGDKTVYQVVGVVEDGKYDSLTEEPTAAMFFPLAQENQAYTTLVVRSQLPSAQVVSALNRMLTGIDASLPFYNPPLAGRAGPRALSGTHYHGRTRRDGPAGSHAGDHRRLWHGGLLRLQAPARTGHPRRPRCAPHPVDALCARPSAIPSALWLGCGSCCWACSPAICLLSLSMRPRPGIPWCYSAP